MPFQIGNKLWLKCKNKKGQLRPGNPENWKHTEATKKLLSNMKKGLKPLLGMRWKLSEELRKNRSDWMKGKKNALGSKHTPERKEIESINAKENGLGKYIRTDEWRKKQSERYRGNKSPTWNGGSAISPYPLSWKNHFKEQIRFRDDYKCQVCGCPETECKKSMPVHHIDYNKSNINKDNLITLCHSCHSKTNHHRSYWIKSFSQREVSECHP